MKNHKNLIKRSCPVKSCWNCHPPLKRVIQWSLSVVILKRKMRETFISIFSLSSGDSSFSQVLVLSDDFVRSIQQHKDEHHSAGKTPHSSLNSLLRNGMSNSVKISWDKSEGKMLKSASKVLNISNIAAYFRFIFKITLTFFFY